MSEADFPEPTATPLRHISPTGANDLLSCGLRIAFASDPAFASWRRPSPHSIIGNAAHVVAAATRTRDDWDDDPERRRAQLEALWDAVIATGADALAKAWSPATTPPPRLWPGYELTRVRTVRRAERDITNRATVTPTSDAPGSSSMGVEIRLADPKSILSGRADRIERRDGHVRVVDLKTGLRQGAPSVEQRRQLLLYAVLIQRVIGEWPSDLVIENAAGEQVSTPLIPSDAETAHAEVVTAVDNYNRLITTQPATALADPDAEKCRTCPYRVCCGPYWRDLRVAWQHHAVLGQITSRGHAATGGHAAVRVTHPTDSPNRNVHLDHLPDAPPDKARWLAAVDLTAGADRPTIHAHWWSRIRTW